jgi:predicted ATPase
VTSRAVLGIRAEHDHLVRPLDVPDDVPEEAERTASVRLFLDRARSVRSDFVLGERNREAVFELCRRLEGIPLAIELAAARVRTLTPQGLLDRLDARLELLVANAPDAPERQRTLRATIEWSHELLTDDERRLFRRLAVFAGGFTLDAAEGVCGDDIDVLDALSGLVEHSLVAPSAAEGSVPRFRMFEMIRVFALDQLEASGEAAQMRERHLAFFEGLATEGEPALRSVDHLQWMARITPEWENLRVAWLHAIELHQTQRAAALAGCGFMLLWKLGRLREMLPLVRATVRVRHELDDNTHGRLLFAGASVSFAAGSYDESQKFVDEFATLESAIDDQMILGAAWLARAFLAGERFDLDGLRAALDRAETIFRDADELWMLSFVLSTRGSLASLLGDEADSLKIQAEVFDLAVQTGNDAMALQALIAQSMSHLRSGDPNSARSALRAALPYFEDYPYFESVAYAYEAGAALSMASERPEAAARLLGAADRARKTSAAALWPLLKPQRDVTAGLVEAALGAETYEIHAASGEALAPRQASALLRDAVEA